MSKWILHDTYLVLYKSIVSESDDYHPLQDYITRRNTYEKAHRTPDAHRYEVGIHKFVESESPLTSFSGCYKIYIYDTPASLSDIFTMLKRKRIANSSIQEATVNEKIIGVWLSHTKTLITNYVNYEALQEESNIANKDSPKPELEKLKLVIKAYKNNVSDKTREEENAEDSITYHIDRIKKTLPLLDGYTDRKIEEHKARLEPEITRRVNEKNSIIRDLERQLSRGAVLTNESKNLMLQGYYTFVDETNNKYILSPVFKVNVKKYTRDGSHICALPEELHFSFKMRARYRIGSQTIRDINLYTENRQNPLTSFHTSHSGANLCRGNMTISDHNDTATSLIQLTDKIKALLEVVNFSSLYASEQFTVKDIEHSKIITWYKDKFGEEVHGENEPEEEENVEANCGCMVHPDAVCPVCDNCNGCCNCGDATEPPEETAQ